MKRFTPFIVPAAAVLFSSCMSMAHFNGGTALPEKRLPEQIKSIVIVNRTQPPFNILNNIATGTIYGYADRPGVAECLNGMSDGLVQSNFYQIKTDQKRLKTEQSASFPPPLSGTEIKNICKEFNTDALLALEVFDVRTSFTFVPGVKIQMDNTGKDYPMSIITASEDTYVSAGWRVYNAIDTSIIDQLKTERQLLWKADGINEENARSKLPLLPVELPKTGSELGHFYVNSISPKTEIISRWYYGKENDGLKKAKAFIKAGSWDSAKQIWLGQSSNNDNKIAGRALYNLAVYYEKQRDINSALEFAKKAAALYKNKYTTLYLQQLNMIKNPQR